MINCLRCVCICLNTIAISMVSCTKSFIVTKNNTQEIKVKTNVETMETNQIPVKLHIENIQEIIVESKNETKQENVTSIKTPLNKKEKKQLQLKLINSLGDKWKETFSLTTFNRDEIQTLDQRFNLSGSNYYMVVSSVYDADTITGDLWAYDVFTRFKIRLAAIDAPEMKNLKDNKTPIKYYSTEHEKVEKILEEKCKEIAHMAKQFVISMCSSGTINYDINATNLADENKRVDNLFYNSKHVLLVKVTEYEAKFGRQIGVIYTLDDLKMSINDKLIEKGLVYPYTGGTKYTFYEQILALKGLEYVKDMIDNSGYMTYSNYIKNDKKQD